MARTLLRFAPAPQDYAASRKPRSRRPARAKPRWRLGPLGFQLCRRARRCVSPSSPRRWRPWCCTGLAFGGPLDAFRHRLRRRAHRRRAGRAGRAAQRRLCARELRRSLGPVRARVSALERRRRWRRWRSASRPARSANFPRGGLAVFYVLGLPPRRSRDAASADALASLARARPGGAAARRHRRLRARNRGPSGARRRSRTTAREFVCSFALREAESFFLEDLALAVAAIRLHRADDVFVALPWSRRDLIDSCLEALVKLPIEVHLGLGGPLRAPGARRSRRMSARSRGLTLTRRPLGMLQQIEKRVFDVGVAALALIAAVAAVRRAGAC